MLNEFVKILLFLIISVFFVAGALIVNRFIRPHRPNTEKSTIYECGEEPVGNPWIRFNIRFYTVALIFLIFEVEVVFLFPWAVIYKELGLFAFIEMVVFLLILILGYVYAWAKGDLEWDKPRPTYLEVSKLKESFMESKSEKVEI
ncbi:NADH-quinone oxidoreductase subunit A [Candidatus Kryptobacter tengchongensis]|uniref:NADH-quinone oxidoreductase subunit A n=1 Tax=Kryptobacter tengchongensis TaxID=1643429 RepID=UPI0007075518|nr:NADH-quinone oxidoreductase subunit A [Candidatus Kryptobacter tengchongensis]CUS93255.1 NADH dehydrogenase subunit A [Candidatus Kryptobacter tengchongensis]